jgi:hypothetical protein
MAGLRTLDSAARLGSALIAAIAALWLVERVFDVSILGF